MRTYTVCTILLGLLALGAAAQQGEPRVRDLTGREVTPEALIDALKLDEAPPRTRGGPGPRSLDGVAAVQPRCDAFRGKSRGLGVKSVALTVHFEFNSAEISKEAEKILTAMATALRSESLAPCCFELEGHTDSVGSDDYNENLSRRRAESVARYLAERFDIDRGRLMTVGYGEAKPIDTNESDAGREKNRRVQIVNLGYGEVAQ